MTPPDPHLITNEDREDWTGNLSVYFGGLILSFPDDNLRYPRRTGLYYTRVLDTRSVGVVDVDPRRFPKIRLTKR